MNSRLNDFLLVWGCLFACFSFFFCTPLDAQNYDAKGTLPGRPAAASDAGVQSSRGVLQQVVIVYKTHFDIGYSETVQQVLHDYRTAMADKVLDAIEKNKQQSKGNQFVWTVSGWPMTQILWEGQSPARLKKLEAAVKDGHLKVHALPFSMHAETCDLEDMVRGLDFSAALARKYQVPFPISAKMSDVPGQSWLLPTLLVNAGVKFYHMGGPVVNKTFGLPPMFWWEGPDGSRLLTLYNNGYGSSPLPPANWPYKTWLYISMTGDNQGPPSPETVSLDLDFFAKKGIKATVGSMDDFANLLLKEDLGKLPVVRADIGDPWIHGVMSMPEASKQAQKVRPVIGALERLHTLEKYWGIYRPSLQPTLNKAYENSLLYSEHTWGLANQHYVKLPYGTAWTEQWKKGLPPQYRLMAASWKDHANYVARASELVTGPYEEAVSALADNVKVNGNHVTIYNPLPWVRSGEIQLDTRLAFGNQFASLVPADGGDPVPISHENEAIEDKQPYSRFMVKDIPAMGYRTYVIADKAGPVASLLQQPENGIIESPYYRARFDKQKGRLVSLIDKRSGAELVDAEAGQGFGQYLYERFSFSQIDDWLNRSLYPQYKAHKFAFTAYDMPKEGEYHSFEPMPTGFSIEQSAIDIKAIVTGRMTTPNGEQEVTMTVTLNGFEPVIDISLSWQKQPDSWPEAAWLCLPFKLSSPRFQLGRLGGISNPAADMNVNFSNHHLFWVNNGAAVYDSVSGVGMAFCSPDLPLLSIGEPGEYKFDSVFSSRNPYFYLNLYNNHWRTNFPAWIGNGQRMEAAVRIWSFNKYDNESALYTPAMETRVPLQAAVSKLQTGQLPSAQSGIELSGKGVMVTAFNELPNAEGLLLRLWEQTGAARNLEVRLPAGKTVNKAIPLNLRGEVIGPAIPVTNNRFTVKLSGYQPLSFKLTL